MQTKQPPPSVNANPNRAKLTKSTSKPMEDLLTNLDNLVDSLEDVTAIEVIGALELVKQRLVFDLLVDEDDEEDAE
jgi:hypothetical protein